MYFDLFFKRHVPTNVGKFIKNLWQMSMHRTDAIEAFLDLIIGNQSHLRYPGSLEMIRTILYSNRFSLPKIERVLLNVLNDFVLFDQNFVRLSSLTSDIVEYSLAHGLSKSLLDALSVLLTPERCMKDWDLIKKNLFFIDGFLKPDLLDDLIAKYGQLDIK